VDSKWKQIAPGSRQSIADGLATATAALLATELGRPAPPVLRAALYGWAYNTARREAGEPPARLAEAAAWLERNTVPLSALNDVRVIRQVLDTLAIKLDGKRASANTIARRRAVFHNALEHAVELGHYPANPLARVKWQAPKVAESVDRRSVVNHDQARALLDAVRAQKGIGPHLHAFFACMYYAAMRPAEVAALRATDLVLPESGWGELHLSGSTPSKGSSWSESGKRERRQLKHRAANDVRTVPCPPRLAEILRNHLAEFGTASDGRLFRGARGGPVPDHSYGRVWQKAREEVFTPAELRSPLAAVPYHLRHAAVSTWLNAGVDATQVAEWAGHSVNVLLKVYAKCVVGRDEIARKLIQDLLDPPT